MEAAKEKLVDDRFGSNWEAMGCPQQVRSSPNFGHDPSSDAPLTLLSGLVQVTPGSDSRKGHFELKHGRRGDKKSPRRLGTFARAMAPCRFKVRTA
jgi:hypothetical protein